MGIPAGKRTVSSPLWHLQEMLKKNEPELFYLCAARLFQIHCGIHIDDLGEGNAENCTTCAVW
jgi:hypothetical protein